MRPRICPVRLDVKGLSAQVLSAHMKSLRPTLEASLAHTDEDVRQTAHVFDEAVAELLAHGVLEQR
jgi:hypothetical protein